MESKITNAFKAGVILMACAVIFFAPGRLMAQETQGTCEDELKITCIESMRAVKEAVSLYRMEHRDVMSVTVMTLVDQGYLKHEPTCRIMDEKSPEQKSPEYIPYMIIVQNMGERKFRFDVKCPRHGKLSDLEKKLK